MDDEMADLTIDLAADLSREREARRIVDQALLERIETIKQALLYAEKLLRDREPLVRQIGADLKQILEDG
jgi:hypothetical protein